MKPFMLLFTIFLCMATVKAQQKLSYAYDAVGDRTKMHVEQNEGRIITRYYLAKQYEVELPPHGSTRPATERLYLGGDFYSAPAVYVKEADVWEMYYILIM